MNFEFDVFVSYAHLDDAALVEGQKGWVANLHRALEIRVGQFHGKPPHIWRDPKLQGNDVFADTLVDLLKQRGRCSCRSCRPRYVRSEWTAPGAGRVLQGRRPAGRRQRRSQVPASSKC